MNKAFLFLVFMYFPFFGKTQCPEVRFIMVDACNGSGSESDNEFFVIHSGDGFNVDDLGFTTPTGTVTANSSNNNDFNATNPCPSCVSGCTINFVTNGGSVPAGQHVVVFTSRNLNYLTYDLSGLCIGGQIYMLVANATPGTGQFANWASGSCSGCNPSAGDPNRTTTITEAGGCSMDATYSRCRLRNMVGTCASQDGGAAVFTNGTVTYNNNGCATPDLPVDFGKFTVEIKNQGVEIFWTTMQEVNNDYFTVQKSSDGVLFDNIEMIPGAGFSDSELLYEFSDARPFSGVNYYRIKQTDFDGKFSFSDVQAVRFQPFGEGRKVVFAPHGILINGGEEPFFVSVYSSDGSLVSQLSHQTGQIELDFDSLTPGVYVLAMHNTFFYETHKFIR